MARGAACSPSHLYRTRSRVARMRGTPPSTPLEPASATRAYSDVPKARSPGVSVEPRHTALRGQRREVQREQAEPTAHIEHPAARREVLANLFQEDLTQDGEADP